MKRTTEYNSWNMAGYRARTYVPPKPYVAIAPIGANVKDGNQTCDDCGYHECSCLVLERRRHDAYRDALIGINPVARGTSQDVADVALQDLIMRESMLIMRESMADVARKFGKTDVFQERLRQHWEADRGLVPLPNKSPVSTPNACPGSQLCSDNLGVLRHSVACPKYDNDERVKADEEFVARLRTHRVTPGGFNHKVDGLVNKTAGPVALLSTPNACIGSSRCNLSMGVLRHSSLCPSYDADERKRGDEELAAKFRSASEYPFDKKPKPLARTWDKCPAFVRPYPDRSHRGAIKAEVRNSERVIVYNPMAAGQADEAYMRCMSLNAQAERAAQAIEANLPT